MTHLAAILRLIIATLLLAAPVSADELRTDGIPVRDIRITGVSNGRVTFILGNREQSRPISEVRFNLDAVPALKRAEDSLDAGDSEQALAYLNDAMQQAVRPWETAWLLYRRIIILDAQGRFTEAAHAWADLVLLDDSASWDVAAPVSPDDRPVDEVVAASLARLREARAATDSAMLRQSLDRLIARVETIAKRPWEPPTEDSDPPPLPSPEPESPPTDAPSSEPPDPAPAEAPPDEVRSPVGEPAPSPAPRSVPTSLPLPTPHETAERVTAALRAGEWSAARNLLTPYLSDTRDYPLDLLLLQYGRILVETGDHEIGVLRLLQCVILFPQSPHAEEAARRAAELCEGSLNRPELAERLRSRSVSG